MAVEPRKSTSSCMFTAIIFSFIVRSGSVSDTCNHPGEPVNGEAIPCKYEYSKGEEITFRCSQNFVLIGKEAMECLGNNKWSSTVPHCEWNISFGTETECSKETWKSDLQIFSPLTDGDFETCICICIYNNNNLILKSDFQKNIRLTGVNIYVKGNSIHSYKMKVKLLHYRNDVNTYAETCHNGTIVKNSSVKNYTCDPLSQLASGIEVMISSTDKLELCEITATSYSNQNLLLNKPLLNQTPNMMRCLSTPSTHDDISYSSTLLLNNSKILVINFNRTYDIDMFIITMNLNNPDDWIQDAIKFTSLEKSTSYKIIRINCIGIGHCNLSVILRKFEILPSQSYVRVKRSCKIKESSPNCLSTEMFDSNGAQYLHYSPKINYSLYGPTLIHCSGGSWNTKPPYCIHNSSILQTPASNHLCKITLILVSVCVVLLIGLIFLVASKRVRWTERRNVHKGRGEIKSFVYEEIRNDIYDSSSV